MLKRSLLTLTILLIAAQAHAEEWPRWRGPRGDGITSETIPDTLPKEGPKQLWSKTVGIGYSSPVAVDGKIYMFALSEGRDTLYAFDEAGTQLWKMIHFYTYRDRYTMPKGRVYKTKTRGAQEAHEAIRPTSFQRDPDEMDKVLPRDEGRLYRLIWQRALASQMAAKELETMTISVGPA